MSREDLTRIDEFLQDIDGLLEPATVPIDSGLSHEDFVIKLDTEFDFAPIVPAPVVEVLSAEAAARLEENCGENIWKVIRGDLPAAVVIDLLPRNFITEERSKRAAAKIDRVEHVLRTLGIFHPQDPGPEYSQPVTDNGMKFRIRTEFQNLGGGFVHGTELVAMRKDATPTPEGWRPIPPGKQVQVLIFNAEADEQNLSDRLIPQKTIEVFTKYRDKNRTE